MCVAYVCQMYTTIGYGELQTSAWQLRVFAVCYAFVG